MELIIYINKIYLFPQQATLFPLVALNKNKLDFDFKILEGILG